MGTFVAPRANRMTTTAYLEIDMTQYDNQQIIDDLDWIAALDDMDHDICDVAREAQNVIKHQETLIQLLAENEKRLRDELDEIRGIIR